MVAGELFISEEMMTAPEHPLANQLEASVAEFLQESPAEIREQQRRDRIPGIVKRIVPIDNNTTWEYWWCVPGRTILPEDLEVLQSDRPRVEAILSRMVWLWGGYCFGEQSTHSLADSEPIYDWQKVLDFAHQQNLTPDILDIDYLPGVVNRLYSQQSDAVSSRATPDYVAVEPAHWHVEFFQLQPVDGGYELKEPKQLCSCQIWTSKPFLKHIASGEIKIPDTDLWLSRPLDLTIPPWSASEIAVYS